MLDLLTCRQYMISTQIGNETMKTICATEFEEQCLALLDGLDAGGLVITRNGEPVARLVPFARGQSELIGSLRDKIEIRGDIISTDFERDTVADS